MTFFFNDTATTEIYTLSLHDALPIYQLQDAAHVVGRSLAQFLQLLVDHHRADAVVHVDLQQERSVHRERNDVAADRKSTRLNSSHANISYAVFCLKKKTSQSADRRC